MKTNADIIVKNANILTRASDPSASAMAILGDRILAVGTEQEMDCFYGPETRYLDADGNTVLPGLNDNHCHPAAYADSLLKVDLSDVKTQEEFLRRLAERASQTAPDQWVFGYGYNEMSFPEQCEPPLAALDAAVPNHPLFVSRYCLHAGVVNSIALQRIGWDEHTEITGGAVVKDGNGSLTGRLDENAKMTMEKFVPAHSAETIADAMRTVCQVYNAHGVTSIADMGHAADAPPMLPVWGTLLSRGDLSLRVSSYLMDPAYRSYSATGLSFPFGSELYRIAGRKLFVDGSIGGGTAGTALPSDAGTYGIYHHSQEELDALVWEAHSRGIQLSLHAMGDEAVRRALDAYKKAQDRFPLPDIRHRIEHCSFAAPDIIRRLKEESVWALFNPNLHWYFGEIHVTRYGERGRTQYPYRSALGSGLLIGNGSDCPVTSPDPRPGIYAAVRRVTAAGMPLDASENISMEEALKTYTIHNAYLTHEEKQKGSLEPGKLADFIVVDRNPLAVSPEEVLEMKVICTVLGGKIVYHR